MTALSKRRLQYDQVRVSAVALAPTVVVTQTLVELSGMVVLTRRPRVPVVAPPVT